MSQASGQSGAVLRTERVVPFARGRVFEAFERADWAARWWGPEGFTNTFERFEFVAAGRWVFVMHGPDGKNYANESVFREIEPDQRVVIEHVSPPWFTLTVRLTGQGEGRTLVEWEQAFESAEMAERIAKFAGPANEQNLDRLERLLAAEGRVRDMEETHVHRLCEGDIRLWMEQKSSIHLKAVTRGNDPVELTWDEARELAAILISVADAGEAAESSG